MSARRLDLIGLLALPLAMSGLQASWAWLWTVWLVGLATPEGEAVRAPSALLFTALTLAAAYATRAALAGERPLAQARRIVLGAGAAAIVLALWATYPQDFPGRFLGRLFEWRTAVSPEFIVLAVCLALWGRGILVGRSRILHADLEDSFYLGILGLAFLLGANGLLPRLDPPAAMRGLLLFFACGATGLALVSFEDARRQTLASTGSWLALNRYWLATTGAVIGLILGGAVLVMAVLSPESFGSLGRVLTPLADALLPYLALLLMAVTAALMWVLSPVILWLEGLLRGLLSKFNFPLPPPLTPEDSASQAVEALINSPAFKYGSRGLTMLLVLGVLALAAALALRRFRLRPDQGEDEEREDILSRDLLMNQLRNLFARRGPPAQPPAGPRYLPLDGLDEPRRRVRQAYQDMLEWARLRGLPRPPGQTPRAYAARLAQDTPARQAELAQIAQIYQAARYASEAPTSAEAEETAEKVRLLTAETNPKFQEPNPKA